MRKLVTAALVALCAIGSAGAIINGEPDGNRHPYVVGLGFFNPDGTPGAFCTGTIVSPTVVVTAGHCTFRSPQAVVWNSPRAAAGPPQSVGIPVTHPDFNPELTTPNTGDLGVVRLLVPINLAQYGALPAANTLDSYSSKKGQQEKGVTLVGYGLQSLEGPAFERMVGHAEIRNVNNAAMRGYGVQTSNSRGNGTGGSGTCQGDSGGPILLGDSNVVVAVNSYGKNANCVGNDYSYRTDTPAARAFLGQFVALP